MIYLLIFVGLPLVLFPLFLVIEKIVNREVTIRSFLCAIWICVIPGINVFVTFIGLCAAIETLLNKYGNKRLW